MSLEACVALVERGDPDRFAVTRAATDEAQAMLWPLYAFNLEIARAPWTSKEPMIAEMRLQWWRDAVEGLEAGHVAGHEVLAPLAETIAKASLPLDLFEQMIEARRLDTETDPFADEAALWHYLDQTAGHLMWLAALALGARREAEQPVRRFAQGAGLAAYLQAVPRLEALGRRPLPDGRPETIAALAREGQARMAQARAVRRRVPASAHPALLAGWQAGGVLHRAARNPALVGQGALRGSEFAIRGGLLWRAISGRW